MATASLAQGKVGLRRALLTLAVAGLALGVAVVLVLATSDHAELRADVVSELVTHLGQAPEQGEIRDAIAAPSTIRR